MIKSLKDNKEQAMSDAIDVVIIDEEFIFRNSLPFAMLKVTCKALAYIVLAASLAFLVQNPLQAQKALGAENAEEYGPATAWRIRFVEAATVAGPDVFLGEIATPAGDIPADLWAKLSTRKLWASPAESGRPVNMTRPRLQQAAVEFLGPELARLCLYPPSMALQRGGKVLMPADIQAIAVKKLTRYVSALPGEASLQDFRLPPYIFMANAHQQLEVEPSGKMEAGRVSLRLNVVEVGGNITKRLTGTVFVDCWINVPCATAPMNKGEALEVDKVTFVRKNLASLREGVWDGQGGPWRLMRPVTLDQVIYQSDLSNIPTVAKGSKVNLVYRSSGVTLTVSAEAMSDGVPGETIPVRNTASRKQIYATVQDGNTVFIRPPQLQAGL